MYKLLRNIRATLPDAHKFYYYSGKYYYEKLFQKYNNIESYLKLLNNSTQLTPVHSNIDVKPELGCSTEDSVKKYGKPKHKLVHLTPLQVQILLYKFIIGGFKTKCELHFFRNKLFLYSLTFSYLRLEHKTKINELLCLKYLDKLVDLKSNKILGKNSNEFFVQEANDLTVYYLTRESVFFQEAKILKEKHKLQIDLSSKKNDKELLHRL